MSSGFQKIVSFLFNDASSRSKSKAIRRRAGNAPVCESLEGRRLLNGSWKGAHDMGGANVPPAHFHHEHLGGALKGPHDRLAGKMAMNPTLQADFKTLRTDFKTLQSEVPAAVTAQIDADRATIDKAIATLTPAERHSLHTSTRSLTPGSDPSGRLTATLQAANVPAVQINSIVADFQNYKNTLETVDPALNAKIAVDQTALKNDLPAGTGPGAHDMTFGHPGMPM